MKWYEVELEIPIYGKNFEIVQALDSKTAKDIALRKTVLNFNFKQELIIVNKIRRLNY